MRVDAPGPLCKARTSEVRGAQVKVPAPLTVAEPYDGWLLWPLAIVNPSWPNFPFQDPCVVSSGPTTEISARTRPAAENISIVETCERAVIERLIFKRASPCV